GEGGGGGMAAVVDAWRWGGHGGEDEIEVEMVVTWCGGSEGGDDSGGEMMVWRCVGCGDGGAVVEAAMVMAAAKAVVVR
ncbi:hypothetical protein Tco_1304947, partial [Tanacetum coccineum]